MNGLHSNTPQQSESKRQRERYPQFFFFSMLSLLCPTPPHFCSSAGHFSASRPLLARRFPAALPAQLLVEHGADLHASNANGCSVAHWAAGGGREDVCRFLRAAGVDFTARNLRGSTPLSKAVAHGAAGAAAWLAEETEAGADAAAVAAAVDLARDLVHVTGENPMRVAILRSLRNGAAPGGF